MSLGASLSNTFYANSQARRRWDGIGDPTLGFKQPFFQFYKHVQVEPDLYEFSIDIYRKGKIDELMHSGVGSAPSTSTPINAS